jgi:class 3 adenylate cyclase
MMDAVHRVEGTVNQVLGDGIMALFRAPLAHEDHALRACYAALAMQTAIREYTETVRRTHGIEMRIRVGLNAGEVVVRAIGNDLHMDYAVRSADIVLLFSGGIGTLNEFTIAYDEGKIIGLLQGTGG